MSINKKTFNKIALADGIILPPGWTQEQANELIKRVLEIMKPSGPTPKPGVTPSIPPGHHNVECRDIFNHMRGLSSVRQIIQYFMKALGELRGRSESFCSNNSQSNKEGVIDAWNGFRCVIKYIVDYIPGSSMPALLNGLINGLSPIGGMDYLDNEESPYLNLLLCSPGYVDQIIVLDNFDVETWEDLFNVTHLIPIPITCPQRIPVDPSLPWWEEFMVWALQGVDPSDLEAAGSALTCVGIGAGVLATGGMAAPFVCTLGVGELAGATAALALVVGAEQAMAIEQALLEVSQSCGNSCCVEGEVADGIDSSEECYELGGVWGSESCEEGPFQYEK